MPCARLPLRAEVVWPLEQFLAYMRDVARSDREPLYIFDSATVPEVALPAGYFDCWLDRIDDRDTERVTGKEPALWWKGS